MITRKQLLLLFFLCLSAGGAYAQYVNNQHVKNLVLASDTLLLDTLSLIPGSIKITNTAGGNIDSAFYKINYAESVLIVKRNQLTTDSLTIHYRTFPYLFSAAVKHKDLNRIKPDLFGNTNPFSYTITSKNDDIFKMDGLNKTGSISRGITFGTNQDVVVNSNLNLQLSGHLSNNIDILLAATDNNIPIQPEGNTQQLQEFDKVFIQLSREDTRLIAGDFQLMRPNSYFMNFYKKAQGLNFSTAIKTGPSRPQAKGVVADTSKNGIYRTTLSAAVSRGKFARNVIQGIESNQGPYRLRGAENEPFIIVLSGTEKVYIDGKLMDRGQENDYIIDYNTSEVTFTAKQLITKDKRIVVEFQYSDKNYARSLLHFGNDFERDRLKLHFNIYSEQDSKNQPLQQDLTPQQKQLLSEIGDTLSLAVVPSADSVPFSNNEVLYARMDTIAGGQQYTIYQYSMNSDSAHYRVTFSNVGQGNGDYKQINSSANGKVFQWIAPVAGIRQGSYAPVLLLITPKQKQMITAGADYQLSASSSLSLEAAMSNNDINTFSSIDNKDNLGYGLKMNFDNVKTLRTAPDDTTKGPLQLITNVNYEYLQIRFSPIERYRSVEFERDWNRKTANPLSDQHIIGTAIGLSKKGTGSIGYKFNAFLEGSNYNANKQFVNVNFKKQGFQLVYDGSLLGSKSSTNSGFYRHKSGASQNIKGFTIGVKDEFENNKFTLPAKDSLLSNSYQFWEWQGYVQNADTAKNKYGLVYKQRNDFAAKTTGATSTLHQSAHAESIGGFFELLANPNSQLRINTAYRMLRIVDTTLTLQKPDNSLVSRIEYNFRLWKGFLSSNTFYEIGSGLEVKKEFTYLEVAPGQGVYTWNDYNENGVKELNEFEIAAFGNTATFIKVYTPTLDYIKVYTNQFSQMLMIKPAALWANKKGVKKFISRFANQTAYRVDRKTTESDLEKAYNPFLGETKDDKLATLNSSFRNTLFVNQVSPVFGIDLTYQDVRNKVLLVNGFDTRQNRFKEATLRWNMSQQFWWELVYKDGKKISRSQFFNTRDYSILYYEASPKLNYQPNTAFKASASFRYTEKSNAAEYGSQKAVLQDYGVEIKYNVLQKGSLNAKANFIQIKYNAETNTSLGYEMLDALRKGKNITWGMVYQRNLSNNLQLSITYDGRVSEETKAVHTGGAQVRAYF
ncbi:MAG: hypothetical protein WAQ28_19455 [Bacteroidia bacterium]